MRRARDAPATSERGNNGAAEIGEVGVGERGAICAGVQRTEKGFQEAPECGKFFAEAEVERAAIGADDEEGYVVGREIFREALADFLEERWDEFLRGNVAEQIDDTKQALFAEHFAVGITGFDERVGVAEEAVSRLEFDIKLLVIADLKESEGNVLRPFLFGLVLVAKKGPAAIESVKEKRAGMASITK